MSVVVFGELLARARYALPDRADSDDEPAEAREERFLRAAFAEVPVIDARGPFLVDPRRVAESIGRLLYVLLRS
jgi:hypothetical protein